MVFWAGILAGGLFAWFAIKIGFFETWAALFNIIISIYISVFLTPIIVDIIPGAGDTAYGNALTLTTTAIATFLILHGISYTFVTGQFNISFPKILDNLGAGLLGFLAGFLVWSFVSLLISATPISQNTFAQEIGFGSRIKQTNVPYICWWCNLVNTAVASQDSQYTADEAIDSLLVSAERKSQAKPLRPNDPNQPRGPNEPNDAQTNNHRKKLTSLLSNVIIKDI